MTQAIVLISIFILIELTQIAKQHRWINIEINDQLLNVICVTYQMLLMFYMVFTHTARTEFEWELCLIAALIPFAEYLLLPAKTEE